MNKIKDMWNNLSKKGKIFTGALGIILLVIIYSYIF
jgi:flagellar biosynthesis/type III secretory pathway M-ring protein FliF/YscJ